MNVVEAFRGEGGGGSEVHDWLVHGATTPLPGQRAWSR